MPSYVFKCKKCDTIYEDLVTYDPTKKYTKVTCPECNSNKKMQLQTSPLAVTFKDPRGTSKGDSFTYLAGYNAEMAKKTRRMAEERSHVGKNPYRKIDDISKGNFGIK